MTEVIDRQPDQLPATQLDSPMSLIHLAIQRDADPAKLERLMDMQERWERNQAAKAFAESLAAFQAECPPVRKTRSAEFKGQHAYSFAGLDDIMRQIQPLLTQHGLAVTFSASVTDAGMIDVECHIRHGTHVETARSTLPIPAEMRVNATQKMGAAMSYAKRYALCAALNITVTDEDDDGAGLTQKPVNEEQAIIIREFAESLGADVADRFLGHMNINTFEQIPADRFDEAMGLLRQKQQAMK